MKTILLFALALFLLPSFAHAQIITTVAGDSLTGYNGDNIPATTATLNEPVGVAVDGAGNIYITDRNNNRIRKVNTSGVITTVAGTIIGVSSAGFSGDGGPATAAQLNYPYGIALDSVGNIYFSDDFNYRIRKIDTSGIITTIAGNGTPGYNGDNIAATSAELKNPGGVAIDHNGNIAFCDGNNNRIREINTAGIITTIAGDGTAGYNGDNITAISAELDQPSGIAIDHSGNIYIADYLNERVRKVDVSGIITTIAGTGISGYNGDDISASAAKLDGPLGIAVDGGGNVYIGNTYNERIRKVDTNGIITTIAGTGSGDYNGDNILAIMANIDPVGVAIDHSGTVYIADIGNYRIRRVGWPESINELSVQTQKINIYPNPATTILTISTTNNISNITISNLLGQTVYNNEYNDEQVQVNVADLPGGVYFVTTTTFYTTSTQKIIINKCC